MPLEADMNTSMSSSIRHSHSVAETAAHIMHDIFSYYFHKSLPFHYTKRKTFRLQEVLNFGSVAAHSGKKIVVYGKIFRLAIRGPILMIEGLLDSRKMRL